jgi:hypothetical protein
VQGAGVFSQLQAWELTSFHITFRSSPVLLLLLLPLS